MSDSLQSAWDNFGYSCVCGKGYDKWDNNCAHFLSNALIEGGYSDIDGGTGDDERIVKGYCVCSHGRPLRAKELRKWFGQQWARHSKPKANAINVVYQENHGQGHVLLKKYDSEGKPTDEYQGTGDFPGWATQEYYY